MFEVFLLVKLIKYLKGLPGRKETSKTKIYLAEEKSMFVLRRRRSLVKCIFIISVGTISRRDSRYLTKRTVFI